MALTETRLIYEREKNQLSRKLRRWLCFLLMIHV